MSQPHSASSREQVNRMSHLFFFVLVVTLSIGVPSVSFNFSGSSLRSISSRMKAAEKDFMVKVFNEDTKQTTELPVGDPMSLAAVRTGMRLSFQCKAGTCGSCVAVLDGKKVYTCQTKLPKKKTVKIRKQ